MSDGTSLALFEASLSDLTEMDKWLTIGEAEQLFTFFKNCPLFKWKGSHNDCEDRANAICMLLDEWNIPNHKGWVFGGYFLKKENGNLKNSWNYHVAAALPVQEEDAMNYYIIDPSSSEKLEKIENWAANVTATAFGYYLVKSSIYYIFPGGVKIQKDNWHKRNKQNNKWTMQGLAGINGLSDIGKAQLCFNKKRIKKTESLFKDLKNNRLPFLSS